MSCRAVLGCCPFFIALLSILSRAIVGNSFILVLLSYVYRRCIDLSLLYLTGPGSEAGSGSSSGISSISIDGSSDGSSSGVSDGSRSSLDKLPVWSESRSPPPGASCYIQDFHSWFLGFFYASRERLSLALRTTADKSYHKMRYALCWMYSSCVWTRHTSWGSSLAMDRWLTLRLLLKMGNLDDDDDDDVWTFLS